MKAKKQPSDWVYIGCDQPFDHVPFSDGSFILPHDGKTYFAFHRREYERTKKPKIIYAIFPFFDSDTIKVKPIEQLRKYDRLYAIDTNYKDVAITTAVEGLWWRGKERITIKRISTTSFAPRTEKPEREAWRTFVESHNVTPAHKYCLVVDSDLGELMRMNTREVAVSEDSLLPENWQLSYATSDVRDDFVMVRMMNVCDRANREFIKRA